MVIVLICHACKSQKSTKQAALVMVDEKYNGSGFSSSRNNEDIIHRLDMWLGRFTFSVESSVSITHEHTRRVISNLYQLLSSFEFFFRSLEFGVWSQYPRTLFLILDLVMKKSTSASVFFCLSVD